MEYEKVSEMYDRLTPENRKIVDNRISELAKQQDSANAKGGPEHEQ